MRGFQLMAPPSRGLYLPDYDYADFILLCPLVRHVPEALYTSFMPPCSVLTTQRLFGALLTGADCPGHLVHPKNSGQGGFGGAHCPVAVYGSLRLRH